MVQEKAVRWAEIHVDSLLTQHLKKPESLDSNGQGTSKKEQALDWRTSYSKRQITTVHNLTHSKVL